MDSTPLCGNQVKDFKVNDQPKKVQVAKVKQMKEVVVSQFDQNQSLKKSNKPQKRNKITKENAEIRIWLKNVKLRNVTYCTDQD